MANNRPIGEHSDRNFVKNFTRYIIIDKIIDSNSWDELRGKLKNKLNGDEPEKLLFREYKMFNYVLIIEHLLCSFIEKLYKDGNVKDINKTKEFFIRQIEVFRNEEKDEAKEILDKQIENDNNNLFNPHIILYVAGMGLGKLISFIRDYTGSFDEKDTVIKKLSDFKDHRNDFVHNLLSSRNDMILLLNGGLKEGAELVKMLKNLTRTEDFSVNVKYIGKFKNK